MCKQGRARMKAKPQELLGAHLAKMWSSQAPLLRQGQVEQQPNSGWLVGEGVQDQLFDHGSEVWDVQLERPGFVQKEPFHSFNQANMTRSCGQLQRLGH